MDIGDLPAGLFSPAKIIYIAYVLLAALQRIETSFWSFLIFSLAFLVVQVFHDDYFRIRLNYWAEPKEQRGSRGNRG